MPGRALVPPAAGLTESAPSLTIHGMRHRFLALLLGVCLAAGALGWPGLALAQDACAPDGTYTVQRGDTLYSIARRHNTTTAELARLNNIVNPNWLYPGQVLWLPGAGCQASGAATPPAPTAVSAASAAAQTHVVQRGDTLSQIAARYGVSVAALVAANNLPNAARIYAGQVLAIPNLDAVAAAAATPAAPALFSLWPTPPVQGRVARVTVPAANLAAVTGTLGEWPILFFRDGDQYLGLVGISAVANPGAYPLTLTLTDDAGAVTTVSQPVTVAAGGYGSETLFFGPDKSPLLEPNLRAAELAQVLAAVQAVTGTRYWQGRLTMPAAGRVTSPFGTRRSYHGGPYSYTSYHDGVDLSAWAGLNVLAPAGGVVVLAETLNVRGNATIIDHGWGVYSGFWHQSAIAVKVGEVVQAGQVIGTIGNTGLSTGAHLHWSLFVGGVQVNPVPWTQEPVIPDR